MNERWKWTSCFTAYSITLLHIRKNDALRKKSYRFNNGEHCVVVRAFGLYWGDIRFDYLSTHHCWSLSKSFIHSLVVWSVTQNNACGGEKQNKKINVEQSDLCDFEQVTLKPQLQAHHCLITWLQIWYHSLLWENSIRKGADLKKQNCLFGVHPTVMGKLTSLSPLKCEILKNGFSNECWILTTSKVFLTIFKKARFFSWERGTDASHFKILSKNRNNWQRNAAYEFLFWTVAFKHADLNSC